MKPWSSSRPLTTGEHNCLAFINALELIEHRFPTHREIARFLDMEKTGAARIVQTLRRRELIGVAT